METQALNIGRPWRGEVAGERYNPIARLRRFVARKNVNLWLAFFVLIYVIFVIKLVTIRELDNSLLFGAYSVSVSFFILSRFALAYFYDPGRVTAAGRDYRPSVSFGVPAKDEGENIRETILRIAASDYPKGKFDVIAVNDGSSDNTLEEMYAAKAIAAKRGVRVTIVNWASNRGKRDGMAECIRRSRHEVVVFIDSDSFVEPATARELAKYFADPEITAVAGHSYVTNADENMLTKMQAVRYYVAFKAYKAAEALFGSVTCCSGCCSAYRRSHVLQVLNGWLEQRFLGVRCTYGDDRSLTNFLLQKGYATLFAPEAVASTIVPANFRKFMKQQLRWKKSWFRENLKASRFMWRRNPIMSLSFYLGFLLPLMAPLVVLRAFVWYPYETGRAPLFYLIGLSLMAVVYGLYYYIHTRDRKWVYGILFATFYTLILVWQLPYAIFSLRDARWGTR